MSAITTITTQPAVEPSGLSLANVKSYLGVTWDSDDAMISMFAVGARQYGETQTHQAWVTTTFDCFANSFAELANPLQMTNYVYMPPMFARGEIYPLRGQPLQNVPDIQFIKYLTGPVPGQYTIWDPNLYVWSPGLAGKIGPVMGQPFPTISYCSPSCVWMRYVAGWDDAGATIPVTWVIACFAIIWHWWENRGVVSMGVIPYDLKMSVDAMFATCGGDWGMYR